MTLRAVALIAFLSGALAFAGCTGSDSLVSPTPTPTQSATPAPLDWLATERRDLLLSTLKRLAPQSGWVAGCVFETKANNAVLTAMNKPQGRAFFSEFTDPALGVSLAVRVEGTPEWTGDYLGVSPNPQAFCYVPR